LNGVVFALDGVLIGAGDLRFLAWAMAAAAAVFVPLAVLVGTSGAGIGWLWAALLVFMSVRGLVLLIRFRTDTWARTG
jgi:Na+-driven multidrug efflux pump